MAVRNTFIFLKVIVLITFALFTNSFNYIKSLDTYACLIQINLIHTTNRNTFSIFGKLESIRAVNRNALAVPIISSNRAIFAAKTIKEQGISAARPAVDDGKNQIADGNEINLISVDGTNY